MRMLVDMHSRGATALRASTAEHAKVLGPDAAAAPPTVATFQLGSLLPGLVRRRCYESRRESKVTRRGYANSGRTRQWHHHRACGGRVNVRRLLPLLLLLMASILRSLHNTCAGGVEPACTDAPDGASPPAGNAKTHSTPSHDDGVEHK